MTEQKKMGRPEFEPTVEHVEWVKQMVKDGATKKYMGNALELDYRTFCKHFDIFIEGVKKEGRKKIAKAVSELAEAGDAKAAIFLLQQAKKDDISFFELEGISEDPIDFLTKVFQREDVPMELRIRAAISAAPYKAPKVAQQGIKEGKKETAVNGAKKGKFASLTGQMAEPETEERPS